ncbi:hypothetical protein GCK32_020980, partial [Trichostrongylus colubriformis]
MLYSQVPNRVCAHIRTISSTAAAFTMSHSPKYDDPEKQSLYKLYRPERVTPTQKGYQLLNLSRLNKGMAFTLTERMYL